MFTRAAGPAWVNGWVCAEPQDGQTGLAGIERPSSDLPGLACSSWLTEPPPPDMHDPTRPPARFAPALTWVPPGREAAHGRPPDAAG